MSDNRPIIALDVDGVLNPLGDARYLPRRGFVRHRKTVPHPLTERLIDLTVWLHPEHGNWLRALALDIDAELMWATTWNELANTEIGPHVDLPELSVIIVTPRAMWRGGAHWKHREVVAAAGTRPLIWLDDQFTAADKGWAGDRDRQVAPTRLVRVEAAQGLIQEQLDAVEQWWNNRKERSRT